MDEQEPPLEEGYDDASNQEKIAGLVEQTRQDVAIGNVADVEDALRQRLNDAGLDVDEQQFASLLASVRTQGVSAARSLCAAAPR